MRLSPVYAQVLASLVLLHVCRSAAISPVGVEPSTELSMVRRDDGPKKNELVPKAGPTIWDVSQDDIGSTWYTCMLGAIANKDQNIIKKLYRDTGSGDGALGAKTEKAQFHAYNAQGELETREMFWDNITDNHDYKTGKHWYIAGSEMTAEDVNGYLGTDHDKLSAGSPVDAYHMLTGERALMKQIPKGDEGGQVFYDLLQAVKSDKGNKPFVFQIGDEGKNAYGLYRRNWYAVTGFDDSSPDQNGGERWKAAKVTYYRAKEQELLTAEIPAILEYVVQTVFPETWPPPNKD
ncbi:hypothetical protein I316_00134 [Kwoniella heveanensis BCC8398]|uniref:Calpain catalytic domain-containing protein n=1 Tax=Kwoniella heveanensis BCC8398 TaxID=1296120 RepID=A0A1B9H3T7_9TREE|nr:hypothetical protein I316_00134 [Kwoniella heveanensis BCC8398]